MPRRTQFFSLSPWSGGLNSSVDPGMIPPQDLVTAENMIFATSGSRLKREGLDYHDALSAIPATTHRSSSGTTRTLVFASTLSSAGPSNHRLVAGENITIASAGSASYNGNFTVTALSTTNVANDTITFTGVGALNEASTAETAITITRNHSVLAIHDYWRTDASNVKVQSLVTCTSQPKFFKYDSDGRRSEITNAGTALSVATSIVNTEVINDKLIFAFDTTTNTPKKYDPESSADIQDLGGTPPPFSLCRTHQARLWTNDLENKDRLHYSATANPELWEGQGDSGYLEIDPGDGDPDGVTIIHPPFKGDLFVTKGRKTYRVIGNSPENYQIVPVSLGIGGVGQRTATAVDLDEIVYVSQKGIHALSATDTYGDFTGAFLSQKIQPTFNELNLGRLKYIQSAYIPDMNSVAFGVSEGSDSANNDVYFYNFKVKEWYKWPNISCQAVGTKILTTGESKLLFGTNAGRIIESQNDDFSDFGSSGIAYRVKSGSIYVDGNPNSVKGFKRLTFLYKPIGDYEFTCTLKIDNHSSQSYSFAQESSSDLLGTTFTLGSSELGVSGILSPYSVQIDGYGRGLTIEITQSGASEQVEIYGVIIEYEPADLAQEVLGEGA
jgi:hypothetical protein